MCIVIVDFVAFFNLLFIGEDAAYVPMILVGCVLRTRKFHSKCILTRKRTLKCTTTMHAHMHAHNINLHKLHTSSNNTTQYDIYLLAYTTHNK